MLRRLSAVGLFLFLLALPIMGFIVIYLKYGPWIWGEDSDSATPLMMINLGPLSFDYIYYLGQDRLGGWPYLLIRGVKSLLGVKLLSIEGFHTVIAVVYVISSLFYATFYVNPNAVSHILRAYHPECRKGSQDSIFHLIIAFLAFFTSLFYHNTSYAINQGSAFVWQILILLITLYRLQKLSEEFSLRNSLLYSFFLVFALWSSPVNFVPVILLAIFNLMFWNPSFQEFPLRAKKLFLATLYPTFVAWILHRLHFRFALYPISITNYYSDSFIFFKNINKYIDIYSQSVFSPLPPTSFPLYICFPLNILLISLILKNLVWDYFTAKKIRQLSIVEKRLLALGLTFVGASWVELYSVTSSRWWELNLYHPRYLTMNHFYSINATFILISFMILDRSALAKKILILCACFILVTFMMESSPQSAFTANYYRDKAIAEELEKIGQGRILLGAYWEVGKMIPFQKHDPLIPLVIEQDKNRTGWSLSSFKTAKEVIVSHRRVEAIFGTFDHPKKTVYQYGRILTFDKKLSPTLKDYNIYTVSETKDIVVVVLNEGLTLFDLTP